MADIGEGRREVCNGRLNDSSGKFITKKKQEQTQHSVG